MLLNDRVTLTAGQTTIIVSQELPPDYDLMLEWNFMTSWEVTVQSAGGFSITLGVPAQDGGLLIWVALPPNVWPLLPTPQSGLSPYDLTGTLDVVAGDAVFDIGGRFPPSYQVLIACSWLTESYPSLKTIGSFRITTQVAATGPSTVRWTVIPLPVSPYPPGQIGKARFLSRNWIDANATIALSSVAAGVLSQAQKEGAGGATLALSGGYTGDVERDYVVQIDNAGDGSIGSATFRWSRDGGASWVLSGLPTSTAATVLENGIAVAWTPAFSGVDVVLNDQWLVKGQLPYGTQNMYDRDRDSELRTGVAINPQTITVTFRNAAGTAVRCLVQALILLDHNLTNAATITLRASDDGFVTTIFTESIPYVDGAILAYLTNASQHSAYRVTISDPTNPDGFLRWSELYLGTFFESLVNVALGDSRTMRPMTRREQYSSGRFHGALHTVIRTFSLAFEQASLIDIAGFRSVFADLLDTAHRRKSFVYYNPSALSSEVRLCEWINQMEEVSDKQSPETRNLSFEVTEVARTIS